MHDRNHHHDDYDHDDEPAAHDEPLAGRLRIRGRPVDQWRLYHHHDDDDDHDDDDHHHDHDDHDDHDDHHDHHDQTASSSPAVIYDYSHDHDSADYYDQAAVLGHPGGVQRNAQGGRKGHLGVLRRAHMRSESSGTH